MSAMRSDASREVSFVFSGPPSHAAEPSCITAAFPAFCLLVTRTIKAQRPALDSPQGPESNRSLLVVLRCQTQQEQPAFTNEFGQGATRWWDFETFWRTPVTVQATSLLSTSFLRD